MNTNNQQQLFKELQNRQLEQGSILVPVLIVAIIIVLVLMWQAGMFAGGESSPAAGSALQEDSATTQNAASTAETAIDGSADEPNAEIQTPRALTPSQLAAQKVQQEAAAFVPQLQRTTEGDELELIPQAGGAGNIAGSNLTGGQTGVSAAQTAAIRQAAASLMANAGTDFSACQSAGSAEQNLECAAAEQTRVLQEAFKAHNAQRESGDSTAIKHGTAIMQVFVENLQESLRPFVEAADG